MVYGLTWMGRHRGKVKKFARDTDPKKACHLTAFMAYKAGMSHVVREVDKPGSKSHKKAVVDSAPWPPYGRRT